MRLAPARRSRILGLLIAVSLGAAGGRAEAEVWAIGPRVSFVKSDVVAGAESTRQAGGLLRARLSPRTALELAIDYRSEINESLTERVRSYPIQGSLLFYPVRAVLAPYLLGGIGWYSQRVDLLQQQIVLATEATRRVGYHAGLGGQLQLGRRAAVHLDYRYTFIGIGEGVPGTTSPGAIPLPGTLGLQERLKLSHEGSAWSGGVALLF
jgi:opacity protein-like surface antigen